MPGTTNPGPTLDTPFATPPLSILPEETVERLSDLSQKLAVTAGAFEEGLEKLRGRDTVLLDEDNKPTDIIAVLAERAKFLALHNELKALLSSASKMIIFQTKVVLVGSGGEEKTVYYRGDGCCRSVYLDQSSVPWSHPGSPVFAQSLSDIFKRFCVAICEFVGADHHEKIAKVGDHIRRKYAGPKLPLWVAPLVFGGNRGSSTWRTKCQGAYAHHFIRPGESDADVQHSTSNQVEDPEKTLVEAFRVNAVVDGLGAGVLYSLEEWGTNDPRPQGSFLWLFWHTESRRWFDVFCAAERQPYNAKFNFSPPKTLIKMEIGDDSKHWCYVVAPRKSSEKPSGWDGRWCESLGESQAQIWALSWEGGRPELSRLLDESSRTRWSPDPLLGAIDCEGAYASLVLKDTCIRFEDAPTCKEAFDLYRAGRTHCPSVTEYPGWALGHWGEYWPKIGPRSQDDITKYNREYAKV